MCGNYDGTNNVSHEWSLLALVQYTIHQEGTTIEQLSYTGFDLVMYTTNGEYQDLFAQYGNQVIWISYHGNGDVRTVVPSLAKVLGE